MTSPPRVSICWDFTKNDDSAAVKETLEKIANKHGLRLYQSSLLQSHSIGKCSNKMVFTSKPHGLLFVSTKLKRFAKEVDLRLKANNTKNVIVYILWN